MLGRILVVDDSAMNRDLLSRRLVKRDYETIMAADAYEAMAILQQQEVDLVILDIMMPGMSGMELLTLIRQKYSPTQLPVIMATAKADSEDVVEALNRGANDYVTKPLDMAVAFARIERALRDRKTAEVLERMNKDLLTSQSLSGIGEQTRSLDRDVTGGGRKDGPPRQGHRTDFAGQKIGKYEVHSELGVGGGGSVVLAYDPLIERNVAIKLLREDDSSSHIMRFIKEAKATQQLDHPNIITIFDVNEHDGYLYIVMEFAAGGSLQQKVKKTGPLKVSEAVRCVVDAAKGLHAAHSQGLIHRDVKPANLLLTADEQVKLTDFGIVKSQAADEADLELTRVGKPIGTPLYMSPEQASFEAVDARTDVYALGGTLYYLLTGQAPFRGKTVAAVASAHQNDPRPDPRRLVTSLPDATYKIIAKAMAIDPRHRYQSMPEFIAAAEPLLNCPDPLDETDIM